MRCVNFEGVSADRAGVVDGRCETRRAHNQIHGRSGMSGMSGMPVNHVRVGGSDGAVHIDAAVLPRSRSSGGTELGVV